MLDNLIWHIFQSLVLFGLEDPKYTSAILKGLCIIPSLFTFMIFLGYDQCQ